MKKLMILVVVSLLMLAAHLAQAQPPVIDGIIVERESFPQVATDPAGDNMGAFDITTVSATSDDTMLFVRFDIGQALNIQNGEPKDGTLRLIVSKDDQSLTVDFRGRKAVDETGKRLGWNELGFRCLPTFASDVYEMKIDLSSMGVKVGDKVSLQFGGSDSLDKPAEVVLSWQPEWHRRFVSWDKRPGWIRIVNQNTLQNGLADSERQAKFKRLFTAINADVYCFQEEWDKDKFLDGIKKAVPNGGLSPNNVPNNVAG